MLNLPRFRSYRSLSAWHTPSIAVANRSASTIICSPSDFMTSRPDLPMTCAASREEHFWFLLNTHQYSQASICHPISPIALPLSNDSWIIQYCTWELHLFIPVKSVGRSTQANVSDHQMRCCQCFCCYAHLHFCSEIVIFMFQKRGKSKETK